jgi:hypothetical protein
MGVNYIVGSGRLEGMKGARKIIIVAIVYIRREEVWVEGKATVV